MKRILRNPRGVWEYVKRLITKNFGLKVISLSLAIVTYCALKDKTDSRDTGESADESVIYDTVRKLMTRPDAQTEKPKEAVKTPPPQPKPAAKTSDRPKEDGKTTEKTAKQAAVPARNQ